MNLHCILSYVVLEPIFLHYSGTHIYLSYLVIMQISLNKIIWWKSSINGYAGWLTGLVKPGEMWQFNFCYLKFASRRKLCKNSVFYENINTVVFILFGKVFIFSRFCSFSFHKCIPLPSLSDIHIFSGYSSGFKHFNQIGHRQSFQLVEDNFFCLRK